MTELIFCNNYHLIFNPPENLTDDDMPEHLIRLTKQLVELDRRLLSVERKLGFQPLQWKTTVFDNKKRILDQWKAVTGRSMGNKGTIHPCQGSRHPSHSLQLQFGSWAFSFAPSLDRQTPNVGSGKLVAALLSFWRLWRYLSMESLHFKMRIKVPIPSAYLVRLIESITITPT